VSSISEWTGLIVRDRQQGRQEVTVRTATGTAPPTSPTGPLTVLPILTPARDASAAQGRILPDFPFTSSVAPCAGVVFPFLTGHPQP
jgi:hypothetical protein